MCGPTPTYQGRFKVISEHVPNEKITGMETDPTMPQVKHVLNFYDPTVTEVCKAQKMTAVKSYRFHIKDYAPILDWLTVQHKTIQLYGESQGGLPEKLQPAGWKGV